MSTLRVNTITNLAGDPLTSNSSGSSNPPGTVIYFASSSVPTGYLKANGTSLNTYTYKDLHKVISNTFGGIAYSAGVTDQLGATTAFTVPDLRGQFIRSWADDGTTYDAARGFGSSQADDFKSHTHSLSGILPASPSPISPYDGWAAGNRYTNSTTGTSGAAPTTGGTETRPRNIALLACIKY
jgi:microcystin-dependent protein